MSDFETLSDKASALVAHRLTFDLDMIRYEYQRLEEVYREPPHLVCTVEWTHHIDGKNLKLVELFERFGKDESSQFTAHRASEDVGMMIEICKRYTPLREAFESIP